MLIFKVADEPSWTAAMSIGAFAGSADDLRDGYVHLSTAAQTRTTVARHFAGQHNLVIAAFDATRLAPALKWEASRGGALFPHYYDALPMAAMVWWRPLPLDADGRHILPDEIP